MTHQFGKGIVGTLRTTDDKVPQEYRGICYEESVNCYGDISNEHFAYRCTMMLKPVLRGT